MADFSNLSFQPTPYGAISTFGEGCIACDAIESVSSGISGTAAVWPAALRVIYTPVVLQRSYTVTKAAWLNGGTVAGNVDVGIYDENGNRLVASGSTAMSGASTIQVVELTDTQVGPGVVFLAMVASDATATFINTPGAGGVLMLRAAGVQQQLLGAMPLPATWTPANPASLILPAISFIYDNTII